MEPEVIDGLLRQHLARRGLLPPEEEQEAAAGSGSCWNVEASKLSGRGLVATRSISRGELVYVDRAMLLGPRCRSKYLPMCAVCHRRDCDLEGCERGCGLPVCSKLCQEKASHRERECAYLRALQPRCSPGSSWSLDVLRALVPVRALFLESPDRLLICSIQSHEAARHGREVDMLKRSVAGSIGPDDEQFMRRVCRAMDANSFETAVLWADSSSSTSLRALFPVGALTNHQCVPNTRHHVNAKGDLLVYSTTTIDKGQEITMTYADLLWDTTMRRQFLQATKHFSCQCSRCSDPTEQGSLLAALHCATDTCQGLLLPDQPLNYTSPWTCSHCRLVIKAKQIASIRAGIATAIEETACQSPRKLLRFIQRELSILVPKTNYLMMEMMAQVVSLFGRVDGLMWQDLTDRELNTKIDYCNELIKCLDTLNCGDCTKKGLLLYELYLANAEKQKRLVSSTESNPLSEYQLSPALNEQNLTKALTILKDDIATPSDYRQIYTLKLEKIPIV